MKKENNFKPGMNVPKSGQYSVLGPRGSNLGIEVTSVKGETFPPTPKAGCSYVMADPTKHAKK